jgi:hypothetical protein
MCLLWDENDIWDDAPPADNAPAMANNAPAVNNNAPAVNNIAPAVDNIAPAVNINAPVVNNNAPAANNNGLQAPAPAPPVVYPAPVQNQNANANANANNNVPPRRPVRRHEHRWRRLYASNGHNTECDDCQYELKWILYCAGCRTRLCSRCRDYPGWRDDDTDSESE